MVPQKRIIFVILAFCGYLIGYKSASKPIILEWNNPIMIATSSNITLASPSLIVDLNNHPHIAWYGISGIIAEDIYYTYLDNEVWLQPENLSNTVTPSLDPLLIADNSGTINLFWGERIGNPSPRPPQPPTDIYYKKKTNNSWTEAISLYHQETENGFPRPSAKADSSGRLFLVWQTPTDDTSSGPPKIKFIYKDSVGCSDVRNINSAGLMPTIGVENSGKIHVVFISGTGSGDVNSIFYIASTDLGNIWSDSILIHNSEAQPAFYPQIIIDRQGVIHVLWLKDFDNNLFPDAVFHTSSLDGINWKPAENLSQNLLGNYFSFSAAIDNLGKIHLVMQGGGYLYYTFSDNYIWSEPVKLFDSTNATEVSLACSRDNRLHLAWAEYLLNPPGIYYSYYDISTSIGENPPVANAFNLLQNYPNPFNPSTTISYNIPFNSQVKLELFSVTGEKIVTLVNTMQDPGFHDVELNSDLIGISSGTYFYKLTAIDRYSGKEFIQTKKLMLVK